MVVMAISHAGLEHVSGVFTAWWGTIWKEQKRYCDHNEILSYIRHTTSHSIMT